MFKNPGRKIQILCKIVFWIGVILSVISGGITIATSISGAGILTGVLTVIFDSIPELADVFEETVLASIAFGGAGAVIGVIIGIFQIALGIFFSWLLVLVMFAFGKLVESNEEIAYYSKSRR